MSNSDEEFLENESNESDEEDDEEEEEGGGSLSLPMKSSFFHDKSSKLTKSASVTWEELLPPKAIEKVVLVQVQNHGFVFLKRSNGHYYVQNETIENICRISTFLFVVKRKFRKGGSYYGLKNLENDCFMSRGHFHDRVRSVKVMRDHEYIDMVTPAWRMFKNGLSDAQSFYLTKSKKLCIGKGELVEFNLIALTTSELNHTPSPSPTPSPTPSPR